jgi:hypothetical protein
MKIFSWICTLGLLALSTAAVAQDVKFETVLDGLDNPCGVAVHPKTGTVYVADSGAGKVIRIVKGKPEDVVVGFKLDVYGKGPMYNIGPLGLAFWGEDTLVVGGGDLIDGEDSLRFFTLPPEGSPAVKVEDAIKSLNLPATDELKAEGNFYALAVVSDGVIATSNGDDTKGWLVKCKMAGKEIGPFERFIATKEATNVDAPVGITVGPKGELVVGQMGEINVPKDGLLTFYNPKDGKMLMNLETGLYDITALAYGKKSPSQLYALDYAWMKEDEGGLFQLIAKTEGGKSTVTSKKLASLDKATSMAFGNDGALYVTVIGTGKEGDAKKPGKLLKAAPGL